MSRKVQIDMKVLGAEVTHQCPENLLQRRELQQLLNHSFSHGWIIFRRKNLLVALRTEKIIAPAKVAQPLQGPVGRALPCRAVPWGNALVSICCAGADSLICAPITRLVPAWLFLSGWCSQATAQIVALFFPRSGNPNHIHAHLQSLFTSQVVFFRKHVVGLFERILWGFLVLFLTSCGNPGV